MIKKIRRFFYNIIYALPFGMKGADDLIFKQKSSSKSEDIGINEVIQKESLGKDLLKGEVTQQVEELRYRTYKVSSESEKYEYIGNGIALKKEEKEDNGIIDFYQDNRLLCADVLTELNRVDKDYGKDKYTLSIIYNDIPRFKLEKYCKNFHLYEEYSDSQIMHITLNFSKYGDIYDKSTYAFLNELKTLINGKKSEFDELSMISFITYRTTNEEDLIQYELMGLRLESIGEKENGFYMTYMISSYNRINLSDKYYSESMDKKYKNKEKKNIDLDLTNSERVCFCSECGKKISTYDSDITKETYGYSLCKECVEKILDKL